MSAVVAIVAVGWGPACGGQVGDSELDPGGEPSGGGAPLGKGGQTATGGVSPAGGRPGTGGTPVPAGGRPSSGGRPNTGGAPIPAGGRPGTGGRPSTGGAPIPAGGRPSSGGRPNVGGVAGGPVGGSGAAPPISVPQQQCYDVRGVYLDGTCYRNDPGACMKKTQGVTVSCETTCACNECTFEYARCIDDGGCRFINACAELDGCRGTAACMKSNCVALIEISGGRGSLGAQLFDQYSACMVKAGCGCPLD